MPYKRARFSPYAKRLKKRARTVRRSSARQLRARTRGSKYGFRIPTHLFHRWITNFNATNVNVLRCTYDTATSVLTQSNGVSGTPTECSLSLQFSLNDIPNVSEFTTLFDQYKLKAVVVTIKMLQNPNALYIPTQSSNTSCNFYPTIWYTSDFDDQMTQTLAQIKEFERVKHRVLYPNKELKIVLRPKTLSQLYRTSVTTGYANTPGSPWLDLANTDIPHYGLKTVFDFEGLQMPATTDVRFTFKINAKYYFVCKNAR